VDTVHECDRRTDRQTDVRTEWARTRVAQVSAGYTVNTYSKPPLYDASKGNDVWFSQRAGFLLLLLRDVDLFIARTDRHDLQTGQPASDSTQLKAGNYDG